VLKGDGKLLMELRDDFVRKPQETQGTQQMEQQNGNRAEKVRDARCFVVL
jgi:hypothetical protein